MIIPNRTFVISGGASGLGRATAADLHAHGGYIAILDLNEKAGIETVKYLMTESGVRDRACFFKANVTKTESIARAVKDVLEWVSETGAPLGAIIAAAGMGTYGKMLNFKGKPLHLPDFDTIIAVNLRGTVDVIRQFVPHIAKNKPLGSKPAASSLAASDIGDGERGVVVMVSSIAAFDGQPALLSYAASKGAIASMALPLARDLAPHGIRAMAIAPGIFETALTGQMTTKTIKDVKKQAVFPERMGRPEEFARFVREIIGNVMLNGSTMRLDGGVRMPAKL